MHRDELHRRVHLHSAIGSTTTRISDWRVILPCASFLPPALLASSFSYPLVLLAKEYTPVNPTRTETKMWSWVGMLYKMALTPSWSWSWTVLVLVLVLSLGSGPLGWRTLGAVRGWGGARVCFLLAPMSLLQGQPRSFIYGRRCSTSGTGKGSRLRGLYPYTVQ